ncbi:hypothetical protein L2E82_16900 [Cichorium intybus]|uniref:Uncharacterized protein n=1 Tax=Cichorium intybus TaxID=13427 RepID=A0ACB9F7C5_CICIN|nr:hypothetical protein L2E82_16900 [Cichorium intybus]
MLQTIAFETHARPTSSSLGTGKQKPTFSDLDFGNAYGMQRDFSDGDIQVVFDIKRRASSFSTVWSQHKART